MFIRLIAALAVLASSAHAANQVLTVGPGGISDYSSLQPAIDAASEGDILLVRTGQYPTATITAKSLTLIGLASPAARPALSSLTISHLGAAQRVTVRGFDAVNALFIVPHLLKIEQCAGAVTIEDCSLTPAAWLLLGPVQGQPLVRVESSARVVFTRCTITATSSVFIPLATYLSAATALRVFQSDVAIYDSVITGGHGADSIQNHNPEIVNLTTVGNISIEHDGGTLLLAGSTVMGGRGGNGSFLHASCVAPSDGGGGLVLKNGLVRIMDSTIAGGAAGIADASCPGAANPGPATVVTGGSMLTIPETVRRFEISSPSFEGNVETISFQGVPNEPVLMLISTNVMNQFVPGVQSMLHPTPPFFLVSLGSVPASGEIEFAVQLPNPLLPVGIEGLDLFHQCAVPGNSGFGVLSAPSVRTLIRAGM